MVWEKFEEREHGLKKRTRGMWEKVKKIEWERNKFLEERVIERAVDRRRYLCGI